MDEWMDGWLNIRIHGWMDDDGWMDEWMDECMGGEMDGLIDP